MTRMVVMGLGLTGRAVVDALIRRGIDVVALDDRITEDVSGWASARGLDVTSSQRSDLASLLRTADAFLPSPGVPEHHPIFATAADVGATMLSEFDLASQWDDRPVAAVTGTDGKTTVVTLVERMLNHSGRKALAVGNTDTPYIAAIEDPTIAVFVVEASSFRLGHSRRFSPDVATWLNFGPDHLDAHADLHAYETAKASIWKHLEPRALAVANRDDAVVARHAAGLAGEVETFGAGPATSHRDHGVNDGTLIVRGEAIATVDTMIRSLPHDVLNALAAAATAGPMGADPKAMGEVIRTFAGLPHRVELIGEIDGVRFVNDSKATTPHASAAALGAFSSIVLIAGGKNKGLSFDDMLAHVANIRHVIAIGSSADDIEAVFGAHVPTSSADSMQDAVQQARAVASSGDVVLLSPACASYDWYRSYVHRGEDFARIVRAEIDRGGSR